MNSFKVLATADWHIGSFKGPERDGVNLRLLDTKHCLDFMVEQTEQERPELVLVSGDILLFSTLDDSSLFRLNDGIPTGCCSFNAD